MDIICEVLQISCNLCVCLWNIGLIWSICLSASKSVVLSTLCNFCIFKKCESCCKPVWLYSLNSSFRSLGRWMGLTYLDTCPSFFPFLIFFSLFYRFLVELLYKSIKKISLCVIHIIIKYGKKLWYSFWFSVIIQLNCENAQIYIEYFI